MDDSTAEAAHWPTRCCARAIERTTPGRTAPRRAARPPARRSGRPRTAVRAHRRGAARRQTTRVRCIGCARSSRAASPARSDRSTALGCGSAASAGRCSRRSAARIVRARMQAETRGVILPAADPGVRARTSRAARAEGYDAQRQPPRRGDPRRRRGRRAARRGVPALPATRRPVRRRSRSAALCANLDVLAFEHSVDRIVERLRARAAASRRGRGAAKFVYLDMEEYRDLDLTVVAFRTRARRARVPVARRPASCCRRTCPTRTPCSTSCASGRRAPRARRRRDGKVRIVKGANLAMEQVEAELAGWPQAPYATKAEVDASYKRMLDRALAAGRARRLRVGVASHNLFDVAWALHRARRAASSRPARDRDARGHGAGAGARRARRRRRGAALHARRRRRRLRGRDRLPVAPPRRERRPTRTSCARSSRSRPARRRGERERRRFETAVAAAHDGVDAPRRARRTGGRSSAASIPTRRSPTSPTPTSRCRPTASGSTITSRRRARRRRRRSSRRPRRSTRVVARAARRGAARGPQRPTERPTAVLHRVAEVMARRPRRRRWR